MIVSFFGKERVLCVCMSVSCLCYLCQDYYKSNLLHEPHFIKLALLLLNIMFYLYMHILCVISAVIYYVLYLQSYIMYHFWNHTLFLQSYIMYYFYFHILCIISAVIYYALFLESYIISTVI